MKPKHSLRNFLFGCSSILTVTSAQAAPYDWTGANNATWNLNTNWSGIVVPGLADDLTILGPLNVAGVLNIDFDADNSASSLIFTNTAATSITNTTSGANKTLTLGSGGITTGAGAVQIGSNVVNQAVNITLNAAQTWDVGAGGLTVTNFIGGLGTGITKTGTGNLTINTGIANGFTGGLNVNRGTLTLDYNNLATPTNLIDSANALQINNGALTITGKNVAAATTAQTFASTLFGAGVNTVNIAKGASATSATLNLGVLTVDSGSGTTFSPTTAWSTTASTTERVFITAGGAVPTLPAGASTIFVNAGVFHRVAGGVTAGTLRLAAVNSSGQLLLKAVAGNFVAGTGVDPTNSYQYAAGAGGIALTNTGASVYGLLVNATSNGSTITLANSGTLTLNSLVQIKASEGVNINAGTGTSNIIIGSEKNLVIAMDNTAGLAINAPIANNGSSGGVGGTASALTIVGTNPAGNPGTVTLGGANTYSGATTITRGTLALSNADALATTSGLILGGTSAATLASSGNTTGITIAGPVTVANSGVTSTIAYGRNTAAQGLMTLTGGITGGAGNVTFTTTSANSGGNVQTIVLGGGVGSAGGYGGNTTIASNSNNAMTLRSGIANALPTTTVLTFAQNNGSGSGRATTFDLNGNNQTLAGLTNGGIVAENRNMTVTSATAATLTINNTADFTFGGRTISTVQTTIGVNTRAQISGAVSLIKDGAGTFTLGGTLAGGATAAGNTFTGSTQILGGILVLGERNSIQNSAFDTANSITGSSTNGLRATVTTLTLGGLTGGNDFSTRFTSTSGGYTGLTDLTLNPGTSVTHSYSGDIGDGATGMNLIKTGAGTQTLSGTNTYTGTTTVSAGVLAVNGTLANTSTTTVSGTGTLQGIGAIAGSITVSAGGTLAPGNSIESLGGGDLSLLAGSTYAFELQTDLFASTPNESADLHFSSGTLDIASGAILTLTDLATSTALAIDSKLTLVSYLGGWTIGEEFTYLGNTLFDGDTFTLGANQWLFDYDDITGGPNFASDQAGAGRFVTITVVPEPRAALLGGLGLLALLRRRR